MPEVLAVTIPQETVNDETVRILSWMVVSGSHVEKEQLLCEVETSKAVLEIHAPDAGIVRYVAAVGDEVPVGSTICEVFPTGVDAPAEPASAGQTAQAATAPAASELPPARFTASARALADGRGIDLASFPPGALVRSADVLRKAGEVGTSKPAPAARQIRRANSPSENTPVPGVPLTWHDLSRRKLLESDILRTAQSECIPSSVTVICRSSAFRARVEALGLSSRTALVVFEAARLLRKYPMFNAVCQSGRMGQYQDVNVGWALDGGEGLVVPVVAHADRMSLREIAAAMDRHLEAYVGASLTPADLAGATFTVSDLSGEGVSVFNPLISRGQSAILGVGSDQPGGDYERIYLTLSFDHQVAEGRRAAQFLADLSKRLNAHAAVGTPALASHGDEEEQFCLLCQRDAVTLRSLDAILIRSELPPGLVCSNCLAGWR